MKRLFALLAIFMVMFCFVPIVKGEEISIPRTVKQGETLSIWIYSDVEPVITLISEYNEIYDITPVKFSEGIYRAIRGTSDLGIGSYIVKFMFENRVVIRNLDIVEPTYNLTIRVTSGGVPIPYATIQISDGISRVFYTNLNGMISETLPKDNYNVFVKKEGFREEAFMINLNGDVEKVVELYIEYFPMNITLVSMIVISLIFIILIGGTYIVLKKIGARRV